MKKRLLSIALVVAMIFAIPFTAFATDAQNRSSEATLEIELETDPAGGTFNFAVANNFEFGSIYASAVAGVDRTASGVSLTVNAINDGGTIQVAIGDFEIVNEEDTSAPFITMQGFTLELTGNRTANSRGDGTATDLTQTIRANQAPASIATVNSAKNAVFQAIIDYNARLIAPDGTAYRVGAAQAQMTWTELPGQPG